MIFLLVRINISKIEINNIFSIQFIEILNTISDFDKKNQQQQNFKSERNS